MKIIVIECAEVFLKISAKFAYSAFLALWFAGLAHIAAVKKQPVMRLRNDIRRDIPHKCFFRLQGVLAVRGKSEPLADAEDMRVNRHGRLIPYNRTDDIGGLAAYPLQGLQILDIIRHLTVIDFH